MHRIFWFSLLILMLAPVGAQENLAAEADRLYAEQSWQQAAEKYRTLLAEHPRSDATPEWTLRRADSMWRPNHDENREEAQRLLEALMPAGQDPFLVARAHYRLAEMLDRRNWGEAIRHFDAAVQYFGGPTEMPLEEARAWLITVLDAKITLMEQQRWRGDGNLVEAYRTLSKIAKTNADRARALFGLAEGVRHQGNHKDAHQYYLEYHELVGDTEQALFHLAQSYQNTGQLDVAVEYYRKLVEKFTPESSQWYDTSRERIEQITGPQLATSVGGAYNPGASIELFLNWKNMASADVTLYTLDLAAAMPERHQSDQQPGVLLNVQDNDLLRKHRGEIARRWTEKLEDRGKHLDYNRRVMVEPLPAGAYLIEARGKGATGWALLLVSRLGLVLRTDSQGTLAFACDGVTSEPVQGADLVYVAAQSQERGPNAPRFAWSKKTDGTDADGLARTPLDNDSGVLCIAKKGDEFAIAETNSRGRGRTYNWQRQFYGATDRPVYRPMELVNWAVLLREVRFADARTLDDASATVRIYDPRNSVVYEKSARTDAYGELAGEFDLSILGVEPPLGEYRINVRRETEDHETEAVRFRIEEYKLPEFTVTVAAEKGPFLPGDTITASVTAEYYFGGPVSGGQLEYVIKRSPLHQMFRPHRKYDWYYDQFYPEPHWWGGDTTIQQETIQLSGEGTATISWDTEKALGQDAVYRIEARVTDASRREITGNGQVKVAQQMYRLNVDPKKHVYRPRDNAEFNLVVEDVNGNPVDATGTAYLYKLRWREDKQHNEPVLLFEEEWRSGSDGKLDYKVMVLETGYYQLVFKSQPERGPEVQANATFWCTTKETKHQDVRPGQLEIIPEKDTFAVGEMARILIVGFHADTHILVSRETEEILDATVVTLSGRSALLEMRVTKAWVPNLFFTATAIRGNELYSVDKQVVIPPESQFLNVEIEPAAEAYMPGATGTFAVKVTDATGNPVAARLVMGVADESVYSIHEDYSPDIRKFFYGATRSHAVRMASSHQRWTYYSADDIAKKLREEEKRRLEAMQASDESAVTEYDYLGGGVPRRAGRGRGGWAGEPMAPAAMPAPPTEVSSRSSLAAYTAGSKSEVGDVLMAVELAKFPAVRDAEPGAAEPPSGEMAQTTVRSDFRTTLFWAPRLETGKDGRAKVDLKYAESLTQWRATARAFTPDTRVGQAVVKTRTHKNVMARLQAPRFLVERDEAVLSANIHNEFDTAVRIKVSIELASAATGEAQLQLISGEASQWLQLGPHTQERVDWRARAVASGLVKVTVRAESSEESDAMARTYPVLVHGAEKMLAWTGAFTDRWSFTAPLPVERNPDATALRVVVTPSLAGSLFDCLDYLAEYPYGCVEQTMSRFLPSAIVAKTLEHHGIPVDQVDPQLSRKVKDGLERLRGYQHDDGGWGWWKSDDSQHWMSTYVCFGLLLLREADYDVDGGMVSRGLDYLRRELLKESDNPDMAAFMLYALQKGGRWDDAMQELANSIYKGRGDLQPTALAFFGLTMKSRGDVERAGVIGRNLVSFAKVDTDNNTAQFGRTGMVIRWSEAAVEATAISLYALAELAPDDPIVKQSVRWLVYNRRGNRWKSTRDTALAVLALDRYLRGSSEGETAGTLTLRSDGKTIQTWNIDAKRSISSMEFTLGEGEYLSAGDNHYEMVWDGTGEIYAFAYLTFFTKEEGITAAGNEVFVQRKYLRIVPQETLLQGVYETKKEMKEGDVLESGDRIEVVLSIECKNNYEYLVFEDYKPAGCEAVDQLSGPVWGQIYSQRELRDEKVAFFVTNLAQGKHEITYRLRAEAPGDFHVLPHQAHAMYVPEIRANSDEDRMKIEE